MGQEFWLLRCVEFSIYLPNCDCTFSTFGNYRDPIPIRFSTNQVLCPYVISSIIPTMAKSRARFHAAIDE